MNQKLIRLKEFSGVDNAISWSVLNKVLNVVKGPISLFFILRYLTPGSQGIWYSFGSLGALTIFAELGFLTIITQFVSHEFANLSIVRGTIQGPFDNKDRFFGLIRFSIKFYLLILPLALIILFIVGHFFFELESDNVKIAWYIFSIVGASNLLLSLFQSIYTGLNYVARAQVNLFMCSFFGSVFNWIMLVLEFGIWALVIGNFIGVLLAFLFLFLSAKRFWYQVFKVKVKKKYKFLKETLPLQGKYAISWISAFFILFLLVPAAFRFSGKVEAGKIGITLTLISAITGVAQSWILTKVPIVNIFVANGNYIELDTLFKKSMKQSVFIQVVLFIGFILSLWALSHLFPSYALRFLNIENATLLFLPQFPQLLIVFYSVYLRAHKKEPLMWAIFLQSILTVAAVMLVFKPYGLTIFLYVLNFIYWAVALPLTYFIFRKKRNIYQSQIVSNHE